MSSRFFLDRSLGGKKVASMLRASGWDVTTMHEHYGRAISETLDDVQWITEMTAKGFILLTADSRIVSNPIEADAIVRAAATVFIIPTGDLTGEAMARRFVKHQEGIWARSAWGGLAAYAVYENRVSRVLP